MPPAWLASWALSTWEPLPPPAEVMVPELVREPPLTASWVVIAPQQPGAVMTTLPWLVRPAVAVRVEEPEPELLSPWTVRVPVLSTVSGAATVLLDATTARVCVPVPPPTVTAATTGSTSSVTVYVPLVLMKTLSPLDGTTPPLHLVASLQLPLTAVAQ